MTGIKIILLIVFSAFCFNLSLSCALGIKGARETRNLGRKSTIAQCGVIFLAIIFLWFLFTRIIFSIIPGIFVYVLIFPLSYIFYEAFQFLITRYIYKKELKDESFISFPGGITAITVFMCVNISSSFFETLVLSFGFTSGILIVFMIIREIRRRAALEKIPLYFQGNPLILVSVGLLSLIISAASLLIMGIVTVR